MRPSAELQVGGRTNSDCFCMIAMINKHITADYSCLVNACQACNTHATSSRFQFQREISSLYFPTAILHCSSVSYTDFEHKRNTEFLVYFYFFLNAIKIIISILDIQYINYLIIYYQYTQSTESDPLPVTQNILREYFQCKSERLVSSKTGSLYLLPLSTVLS